MRGQTCITMTTPAARVFEQMKGSDNGAEVSARSRSRWAFCSVSPCFFSLGPVRCGPMHFSGAEG